MNLKNNIKQIVAAVLLLVFMLGATPKIFLHDAVITHTHQQKNVYKCSHHHINISAQGFNCQVDSMVVEMPFIIALEPSFLFIAKPHNSHYERLCNSFISIKSVFAFLRGPPNC